jgi:UDP-glucose 4-epimerase
VLVTGATGSLGVPVAAGLRAAGVQVTALSSRGGPATERCDIRDGERLRAVVERVSPEVVVHLAALMPAVCSAQPALAAEVNVTATARCYEAAARAGVRRFVYASSKSAYGPRLPVEHGPPEYRPIPETLRAAPVSVYDVTKRAGEQLIEAQHAALREGPEPVSLRFATIYGPGKGERHGGASVLSTMIASALARRPFHLDHGGDQVDDVIWVGDAAAGVVAATLRDGPLQSLYNIATGTGIAISEFARRVADACPGCDVAVGPGLAYMGAEPTYGVLDVTRARAALGFAADPSVARGVALFAEAQSPAQA